MLDALVLALLDKETLDKEQVAEVFTALRRRPERPAWTGSPNRVPSTIPPVEIPEEIRRRAEQNGQVPAAEPDNGQILTPPGPGGDVYGGTPTAPSSDPQPPAPTSGL